MKLCISLSVISALKSMDKLVDMRKREGRHPFHVIQAIGFAIAIKSVPCEPCRLHSQHSTTFHLAGYMFTNSSQRIQARQWPHACVDAQITNGAIVMTMLVHQSSASPPYLIA